MKCSDLKAQAKAALKGHWGVAILVTLAYIGVMYIVSLIPVIGWALALATPVFAFGIAAFYLSVIRNGDVKVATLFTVPFDGFLKKLGACWLQALYLTLWSMLFIIPGIVKSYSYAMTEYILLDNPEMGINEAITKSRQMMNGYKWKLFVLDLSFILWRLLCMIPVVGQILNVLFLTPYVAATRAQFYEELKEIQS